jgi:Delta3-Delta2-enoyl-CoA isomerase
VEDVGGGVHVMKMVSKPVNALSKGFMEDLLEAAAILKAEDTVEAVVMSSDAKPGVFSAGLNLAELVVPHDPKTHEVAPHAPSLLVPFVRHVSAVTLAFAEFPKPLIAAVNGAAPAGGCMLALAADYRVMATGPKNVIGLNESLLGIRVPWWLNDMFLDAVGPRQAELLIQTGELVGAEEAYRIGLVDKVATSSDDCVNLAIEEARKFLRIPARIRNLVKLQYRHKRLEQMRDHAQRDALEFATYLANDHVQHSIRSYVQSLAKRK